MLKIYRYDFAVIESLLIKKQFNFSVTIYHAVWQHLALAMILFLQSKHGNDPVIYAAVLLN